MGQALLRLPLEKAALSPAALRDGHAALAMGIADATPL